MSDCDLADAAAPLDLGNADDAVSIVSYRSTCKGSEIDFKDTAVQQTQWYVLQTDDTTHDWRAGGDRIEKWMRREWIRQEAPPCMLDDVTPLDHTATWKQVASAVLLPQTEKQKKDLIEALGWIIENAHGVKEAVAFHRSAVHCTPTQCCLIALYFRQIIPTGFLYVDHRHSRRRLRIQGNSISLYKPFPDEECVPLICVSSMGRISEFRLVHLRTMKPTLKTSYSAANVGQHTDNHETFPIWRPSYTFAFSLPLINTDEFRVVCLSSFSQADFSYIAHGKTTRSDVPIRRSLDSNFIDDFVMEIVYRCPYINPQGHAGGKRLIRLPHTDHPLYSVVMKVLEAVGM